MSTIHQLSSVLALPEFDIFGIPPTQLTVEGDLQTEHRPISTITNSLSPIEFEIHTGLDEYVNLGKSELYLCLQISVSKTSESKNPAMTNNDWKDIAPINYLMNSFFKQIKIEIGQTPVTSSSLNYAYVAYLDALLNHTPESKRTHLQSAFWHRDLSGKMDEINIERSARIRPSGNNLNDGCEFEMYGNLHLDLGAQMKSIIGGVTIGVTLYPNDHKFYLMHKNTLVPKVNITDIRLFVHRSKLTPQVVIAHNRALNSTNARYFITRKEVKSFIIQNGTIDCYLNNVENGVLPRKLFIGLVSNDAFNGNTLLNPFYFKNYGLRHIACYLDGTQYPHRPFTPDFANKKYMREYYGLFETMNQVKPLTTLDITREEFKEGFTIFGFNFTPDLSDGCNRSGYTSPIKRGNLRIELKFSEALNETVSAVIFCEYDNLIEIQSNRVAIKDFN